MCAIVKWQFNSKLAIHTLYFMQYKAHWIIRGTVNEWSILFKADKIMRRIKCDKTVGDESVTHSDFINCVHNNSRTCVKQPSH